MRHFIFSFLKYLLDLVELVLVLRIILKYFSANPKVLAAYWLYKITGVIIFPFKDIFPDIYFESGRLFDLSAFSAGIGYLILIFVAIKFLHLFFKKS